MCTIPWRLKGRLLLVPVARSGASSDQFEIGESEGAYRNVLALIFQST